jgi:hypothetical protein
MPPGPVDFGADRGAWRTFDSACALAYTLSHRRVAQGVTVFNRLQVATPVALAAAVSLLWSPPPAHATDGTALDVSAFAELQTDPRPDALTRNNHYVVSNEDHAWLFHRAQADLGGVLVGVGTDQIYLYAGWFKPQVVVPMDFDVVVADLHRLYGELFKRSKTPAELIAWWDAGRKAQVRALIDETFPDQALRARVRTAYNLGQRLIGARLQRLVRKFNHQKVPTFLNNQTQFDFVRQLHVDGRVFPVRGDLTADRTMKSIGDASRKAGLPVRLLYLSNAEQYFPWTQQYRDNILGLPFDDQSVVLRTLPDGKKGYYYFVQSGPGFHEWVKAKNIRKVFRMLRYKTASDHERYFTLVRPPPAPKGAKAGGKKGG